MRSGFRLRKLESLHRVCCDAVAPHLAKQLQRCLLLLALLAGADRGVVRHRVGPDLIAPHLVEELQLCWPFSQALIVAFFLRHKLESRMLGKVDCLLMLLSSVEVIAISQLTTHLLRT